MLSAVRPKRVKTLQARPACAEQAEAAATFARCSAQKLPIGPQSKMAWMQSERIKRLVIKNSFVLVDKSLVCGKDRSEIWTILGCSILG